MYPELMRVGCAVFTAQHHRQSVRAEIAASLLRQRFAIFGGIATVQPAQPRSGNPVAQLDDVHSVLRLNYETLRGLISLASLSVAKPTLCETRLSRMSIPALDLVGPFHLYNRLILVCALSD